MNFKLNTIPNFIAHSINPKAQCDAKDPSNHYSHACSCVICTIYSLSQLIFVRENWYRLSYHVHLDTNIHVTSRHVTDLISEVISEVIRMTTDPVVIRKFMDSTYSSKSMILIINNLGSRCLNIIRRNSINPTEYLSRSHSPSISKQLSSNILSNIGVSIKSMSMVALRLTLARSTSSSAGRSRRYRRFFSGVAY